MKFIIRKSDKIYVRKNKRLTCVLKTTNMKTKQKLGSDGFAHHFLIPIIAVIVIGFIGANADAPRLRRHDGIGVNDGTDVDAFDDVENEGLWTRHYLVPRGSCEPTR